MTGTAEPVTTGDCTDLHLVDTGMYDTEGFGSVYLLDAERPAVVETGVGTGVDRILSGLDAVGIDRERVAVVAVTHVHLDHAGGAGRLAQACPNAEVVVHERGAPHLADPTRLTAGTEAVVGQLWPHYAEPVAVPERRLRPVTDGDRVDLGDHALVVRAAPGHAAHQVVYHDPANAATFTGDAAGVWLAEGEVRPTTPPPEFDLERARADLDTVRDLAPTTLLYSHFGPHPDPEGALDACETALLAWVDRVATLRESLDDDTVLDRLVDEVGRELTATFDQPVARGIAAVDTRGVLDYLATRDR